MGAQQPPLWRVILAGLIGNVMEWYDFALYGYFVGISVSYTHLTLPTTPYV